MIVPGSPNAALLGGNNQYRIARSLRFRGASTAYLSRTPTTQTEYRKWTYSAWVKRGSFTNTLQTLFGAGVDAGTFGNLYFDSDTLRFAAAASSTTISSVATTAVFRDPAATMHVLFGFDTTQATDTNRLWFEINGVRQTVNASMWPALNNGSYINNANAHAIGVTPNLTARAFDGLQSEINFIDGQALTSNSFGETDPVTGVWRPKKYAGTYGTNGFYLDFSDNSAATAATIGKDRSGNNNDWTPTNISIAAGATNDSLIDSPTNYDDGGNGRGNYAVLNPLTNVAAAATITNGNLTVTNTGHSTTLDTIQMVSGKWYAEATLTTNAAGGLGFTSETMTTTGFQAIAGRNWYYDNGSGGTLVKGTDTSTTTATKFSAGQVWQMAIDIDAGLAWLGTSAGWMSSAGALTGNPATGANPTFTFTAGTPEYFMLECAGAVWDANFGQRPFSLAQPAGFKALNTQNLPDPAIKKPTDYFDIALYTGTGASQNIVNASGLAPDLFAYKDRSAARDWGWFDKVRGATAYLASNTTAAESVVSGVTAFNSNGVTLGGAVNSNGAAETYVGFQWKRGMIPGFDIVTYVGTGANRTIAHGLGSVPAMLIVKDRGAARSWNAWHKSMAAGTGFLILEATDALSADATKWNSAAPTSSVFSLGSAAGTNAIGENYVAYLWAEIAGFSKFGNFTGNGSANGPFLSLGFRPKFAMVKRTDTNGDWIIVNSATDLANIVNSEVYANLSNAEAAGTSRVDILSNGIKIRSALVGLNASGGSYIFMAFAETPFKYARAR